MESYRTTRNFGYGYGKVTDLTEVPGIVARAYITHRSSGRVQKCCTRTPRIVAWGVQTHKRSGYGYACPTELTEAPGTGMTVLHNFRNFRVLWHGCTELTEVPGRYEKAVPVPRVCAELAYRTYRSSGHGYECPTKLAEVPGTDINALQNSQKFQVRVIPS